MASPCFVQNISTFVSHYFFTTHYETFIMCFLNNNSKFSRDKALTFMSSTFMRLIQKVSTVSL